MHVAVPFDTRWSVHVDGAEVPARRAFCTTIGYDVAAGGEARLRYDSPSSRPAVLVLQLAMWVALLLAASRVNPAAWRRWRGGGRAVAGGPLVTMNQPIVRPGAGAADPLWSDRRVDDQERGQSEEPDELDLADDFERADAAMPGDEPWDAWDDDPWGLDDQGEGRDR